MSDLFSLNKGEFKAYVKGVFTEILKEIDWTDVLKEAASITPQGNATAKEVAAFFRITKQTLYNWVKRGLVKLYKIEGRSLFKIAEIEEKMQNIPGLFGKGRDYSYRKKSLTGAA